MKTYVIFYDREREPRASLRVAPSASVVEAVNYAMKFCEPNKFYGFAFGWGETAQDATRNTRILRPSKER